MLTNLQRKLRREHLGASDIPALFGLDPFKTGADVWMSKAFDLEVGDETKQSDAIEIGNDFEAPLLGWAARELGVKLSGDVDGLFAVCEKHPVFSATLDERIVGRDEAIEAKTTSRVDEYGEPGTDQIPDRVNIQVQAQMLCHDLKLVHVAVLMGRNGLKREIYHVERNDEIIKAIIQRGEWFWNEFVVPKKQPPELDENGEPLFGIGNIEIIKRVRRMPQTWAEVPDELIDDWDTKRRARLAAAKEEKIAMERMLTALGDAEGAQLLDGRTLEYIPTVRKTLDQRRLKAEMPDVYESMLKESISKTPRLKKGDA